MGLVKRVIQNCVLNEEKLYRSVRGEGADEYYYEQPTGRLIIESKAFLDRQKEPSVDRAKLNNFDPGKSRIREEDGVVTLIAHCVRQIGKVSTRDDECGEVNHVVDVKPDPISENKAHARIVVEPGFLGSKDKQKSAFKLLRKALARLATQSGWTLKPRNS